MRPLQNLFGKSPFKALQQHMRKVGECADPLPALTEAMTRGEGEVVRDLTRQIHGLAQEADNMVHALFLHLPKSLFMPVDRQDLLEIIHLNDEVANECQRVAQLLAIPVQDLPPTMAQGLKAAAILCLTVVQNAVHVIEQLDELVEVGFGGRDAEQVLALIDRLNVSKVEAEHALWSLSRQLFDPAAATAPLTALYCTRLLDEMARIPHAAEKAGNRMRLLLAR